MALVSVVLTAARNNAEWCDALCRTYGVTGVFHPDDWTSPERTPRQSRLGALARLADVAFPP
jgi:hypothetical protein